jgi:hypothetical protein
VALSINKPRLPELHSTTPSHSDDEAFLSVELKHMRPKRIPEIIVLRANHFQTQADKALFRSCPLFRLYFGVVMFCIRVS